MVTATLDDQACSLELPADCFTVAAAASYAKRELGAAWAGACSPTCISQHGIIQFNSILGYLRNVGKYSRKCPLPACAAGNASRGCLVLCICMPPCPARCSPSASLVSCVRPAGRARPSKKRLFLSAKGWQPGGEIAADASLLAFCEDPDADAPTTDELPASLLRGGLLQLRAFTAQHAQVRLFKGEDDSLVGAQLWMMPPPC